MLCFGNFVLPDVVVVVVVVVLFVYVVFYYGFFIYHEFGCSVSHQVTMDQYYQQLLVIGINCSTKRGQRLRGFLQCRLLIEDRRYVCVLIIWIKQQGWLFESGVLKCLVSL